MDKSYLISHLNGSLLKPLVISVCFQIKNVDIPVVYFASLLLRINLPIGGVFFSACVICILSVNVLIEF